MWLRPRPLPLEPTEAACARIRAALGDPPGLRFDLLCGDVVAELAPEAAAGLRIQGGRARPGRRVLLGGEVLRRRWRRVRLVARPPVAPPAGTRTLARQVLASGFLGPGLPGPQLVVLEGAAAGRRWPLRPGTVRVGRALDADVVLPGPGVSRRHARLQVEAGRVRIRDDGSRHGLHLGRRRVRGWRTLRDGDVLGLGDTRLAYLAGRPAPPAPPTGASPGPRRRTWVGMALLLLGSAASLAGALW